MHECSVAGDFVDAGAAPGGPRHLLGVVVELLSAAALPLTGPLLGAQGGRALRTRGARRGVFPGREHRPDVS